MALFALVLVVGAASHSTKAGAATSAVKGQQSSVQRTFVASSSQGVAAVPLGTHCGFNTVDFADAQHGCAGGRGIILCTTNGGRSWQPQYRSRLTVLQIQLISPIVGWAVESGRLLATESGGRHWLVRAHLPGLRAVAFVTRRYGWALTANGHLLATATGGRVW